VIASHDWIMLTAPKTGCTSLYEAIREAQQRAIGRASRVWTVGDGWHNMTIPARSRKLVYVTVRDPRSRLVSLWQHWRLERGSQSRDTFSKFCQRMASRTLPWWFQLTLSEWYADVPVCYPVRLERWPQSLPPGMPAPKWQLNKTVGGQWQEWKAEVERFSNLWEADAKRWYPELLR